MQKMAERLRPPSFKEGFSKITVVRVKGQPGSAATSTDPELFNEPVPADVDTDGEGSDVEGSEE
jgi:hypothetical protein